MNNWHDKSASASNIDIGAQIKPMGAAGQPLVLLDHRTRSGVWLPYDPPR